MRSVLLVTMFGCVNQAYALSERNLKILTVCSGVTAATLGPIILHGCWLKNSDHSTLQTIGLDTLAMLIAGGGASALTYYLLRQCTPEYKVTLAEYIREMVEQDPFYANMTLRSSDDFLTISALYFGPREPVALAHRHIDMLRKQLDDASILITQAFSEIKSKPGADLFRSKCIDLTKDVIAMKNELNDITFKITVNNEFQKSIVPDVQVLRKGWFWR